MKKTLRKSRTDRKLGGVIGGLARYFGFNSTFLRIIFLIALIPTNFVLIVVYTILMVMMPRDGYGDDY